MRDYHLALVKGNNGTVFLQARYCKDALSPEAWRYLGRWAVTKKDLRGKVDAIREWVNKEFGESFTRLVVD